MIRALWIFLNVEVYANARPYTCIRTLMESLKQMTDKNASLKRTLQGSDIDSKRTEEIHRLEADLYRVENEMNTIGREQQQVST